MVVLEVRHALPEISLLRWRQRCTDRFLSLLLANDTFILKSRSRLHAFSSGFSHDQAHQILPHSTQTCTSVRCKHVQIHRSRDLAFHPIFSFRSDSAAISALSQGQHRIYYEIFEEQFQMRTQALHEKWQRVSCDRPFWRQTSQIATNPRNVFINHNHATLLDRLIPYSQSSDTRESQCSVSHLSWPTRDGRRNV